MENYKNKYEKCKIKAALGLSLFCLVFFFVVTIETLAQDQATWLTPTGIVSSSTRWAERLIDDDINTLGLNEWKYGGHWVIVDLGKSYNVEKIRMWHRQWNSFVEVRYIYVSENINDFGESFGPLIDLQGRDASQWVELEIPIKRGRYIKLVTREFESDEKKSTNWREFDAFVSDGIETSEPPTNPDEPDMCGNGIIDSGEMCDGENLSGKSCSDMAGFWGGTLSCRSDCSGYDVSSCSTSITSEIVLAVDPGTDISDDIQKAADALANIGGGTIILPEGAFQFNKMVSMKGSISIIGKGADKTILLSNVSQYLEINRLGREGGSFRISGIDFRGTANPSGYTHNGIYLTNIVDFRIDHCNFEGFAYAVNVRSRAGYPSSRGVIDHSSFTRSTSPYQTMYGVSVSDFNWNPSVSDFNTFNYYLEDLGTNKAVFVEDCYFEGTSHSVDAFGGGHFVLRHSTIVNAGTVGGHGPGFDSSGRGTRCREIYNNYIKKTTDITRSNRWILIGTRGGGGVVFNNILENDRYGIQLTLDTGSYSDSDGDGYYDYPAMDQIHNYWIWGNTLVRMPDGGVITPNNLIMHYGAAAEQLVLPDRDYFERAPEMAQDGFVYTPYIYPHPLVVD